MYQTFSGQLEPQDCRVLFLAGRTYYKNLLPYFPHHELPLSGLGFGKRLQYLKKGTAISAACTNVHLFFNKLHRFSIPFDANDIPQNGLYVVFEKVEQGHGKDRIVRIGTHTGNNQLRSRLEQHFLTENKDRSIFRKNIGRCLLNKLEDPFLKWWEIDLTSRDARKRHSAHIDKEKLQQTEQEVTKHMQGQFSFAVISVETMIERLLIESRIIATIAACAECKPSDNWLGSFSPNEKIRTKGLWLVNGLAAKPLREKEVNLLSAKHLF